MATRRPYVREALVPCNTGSGWMSSKYKAAEAAKVPEGAAPPRLAEKEAEPRTVE